MAERAYVLDNSAHYGVIAVKTNIKKLKLRIFWYNVWLINIL